MSSEKQVEFTREKIDLYLKEVAKEYRKQAGTKIPAEIVIKTENNPAVSNN